MTAAATARPTYRSMLISLMWTVMSSRTNRRLCGHGQPPTCLDAHEHEHHDLNHDRVEIGRADDEALPERVEPAVREGEDEMREHRGRDAAATTSPTVNGSDRFAWMSVPAKSAKPAPTMSAPVHRSRRRDDATRPAETNETPATIVKAASAGLSPRSWPRSIAAAPSAAQAAAAAPIADDDRVRAELGAGCCERGQQSSSGALPLMITARTSHATRERVGLATLPARRPAGTILSCAAACSSSTTTAPFAQPRDSCSSGAASSSWPRPTAAPSAVQEAKAHRPDLALVDVQLPDFDGFEVAEQLCRLDPAPRVILTSSLDGSDFGALVASSPALGFIPKSELSARAIEALLAPTR